jgi:hypothetical protein
VEDLAALWCNVVVGHDDIVTTPSRCDVIIDAERFVEQARLFDTFGQEDLLDVFSDDEENNNNGEAYEEYLTRSV